MPVMLKQQGAGYTVLQVVRRCIPALGLTARLQVVDYATFVASGRSVCNIGAPEDQESTQQFVQTLSAWVILVIDLSAVRFCQAAAARCRL